MIQECNYLRVLEVFFTEPTTIHFIKEISKRIKLAPTSVRNYIKKLLKNNLIEREKSKPFDGFVANRDNEDFIFYKRVYNFYTLKKLKDFLFESYYPKSIIVFGSYSIGEDVESSDIDIVLLSKTKKEVSLDKYGKKLKRAIHLFVVKDLKELDKNVRKNIQNGIVLYGGF